MNEQLFKVKIVQIIAILLFSLCTIPLFGQTSKVITQIDDNLYQYRAYNEDGKIQQKGYYKKIDGNYEEHWYWRDYAGTVAYFENGKMLWIKPKGHKKYTYEEIEYHRMKSEIERLKAIVALKD